MTDKPRVATVIVLGDYHAPKFNGLEPNLFGQTRGFYNPTNGNRLKGSPGERSIFGEHVKLEVDGDSLGAALRCANSEFWLPNNDRKLTRDDFMTIATNIETDNSVNDLFFLKIRVAPEQIGNGEGDGLLHIPLSQYDWYIRDGNLTEASITTLAKADIPALWASLGG